MKVIEWLLTPDNFAGDWRGYALNQLGHVALGAAFAWLLGPWWALALCVCWEVVHVSRGGTVADSCEDFGFVASGAFALMVPPLLVLVAPFFAAGVAARV